MELVFIGSNQFFFSPDYFSFLYFLKVEKINLRDGNGENQHCRTKNHWVNL